MRIDGPDDMPADLTGIVGITASASAPDDLVRSTAIARLAPTQGWKRLTVTEEDEYFPPPRELRELLRNAELPGGRPGERDPELRLALSAENAGHLSQALCRDVSHVEAEMASVLEESVDDSWLRGAIGCHFGRAHDALFGSGRDVGESNHLDLVRVLPFAAALELLHNYSLVHDDIQDGVRQRRGRATLWTRAGWRKPSTSGTVYTPGRSAASIASSAEGWSRHASPS